MNNKLNRAAGRLVQKLRLVTFGHILNPFWGDRIGRRKRRYKATYKSAMHYLKRYAPYVRNIVPEKPTAKSTGEKAFTIWYQGEENAPALVKSCIRSMRRNIQLDVVVLTDKTLFDYISLPDYIVEKWKAGKIPHTQFSDICRVELLYQHGGLWLDATDYVTTPIPQYIMDEDFFLFMAGEKIRGSYAVIQSCFIRGKKGNPVLGLWRKAIFEYWKYEDSKINYFIHHLLLKLCLENNEIAARNFAKMPKVVQDPTHALWGEHCLDPYSKEDFEKLTAGACFQKTNFKDKRLNGDLSGTMAEYILKS